MYNVCLEEMVKMKAGLDVEGCFEMTGEGEGG